MTSRGQQRRDFKMTTLTMTLTVCSVLLNSAVHVSGSIIHFNATTNSIKPLLTKNLTLRCSLADTSPVDGGLVGRSLDSQGRKTRSGDIHFEDKPIKRSVKSSISQRSLSVTNTTENVDFVTSILISQNDVVIASISDHVPARPVVSSPLFHVTGILSDSPGERGYLELSWEKPTHAQAGIFKCDVDSINSLGQSFDFTKTLNINEEEISLNDLIKHVAEIDATMIKSDSDLRSEIAILQHELMLLKNDTKENVFFSVSGSSLSSIPSGQIVVYSNVFSNVGNAFDKSTGTFTCPVDGYYQFIVSAETTSGHRAELNLKKNNGQIFGLFTKSVSGDYQGSTNSAIVQLVKGDTIAVTSASTSVLYVTSHFNTFSGKLIALA